MATKVTRDHHLLSRNLKLNGNYISNDGDDEGISISDAGVVTIGTDTDADARALSIYKDVTETAGASYWGQKLKIERSGIQTTGTATIAGLRFNAESTESTGGATNVYGVWGEATGEMAIDAGSMYVTGMRVDACGHTNGSGTVKGLVLNVEGASGVSNYGILLDVEDGGRDIRISSSADSGDYCDIKVTTAGATTILTMMMMARMPL